MADPKDTQNMTMKILHGWPIYRPWSKEKLQIKKKKSDV